MELHDMAPEDLIESTWLGSYEREVTTLWWQLVRLNSNIFVLEKLSNFPFELFEPAPSSVWDLIYDALFEACIAITWRVGVDTDEKILSLRGFKNAVFQHLRKEHCKQFARDLQKVNFEQSISALEPRIYKLRNNYIAHFNRDWNANPSQEQLKQRFLQLSDLKEYRDALNKLFNLLCFGHGRALLPFTADSDVHSDVERLLDKVAKDSDILNLPELQPSVWPSIRAHLSQHEIDQLNKYRAKFGMSIA